MDKNSMIAPIAGLFFGVFFLIFGLVLGPTIIAQAIISGGTATIGSFAGTQAINDLIPLIYYTVVVIGGLGLIGVSTFVIQRRVRGG